MFKQQKATANSSNFANFKRLTALINKQPQPKKMLRLLVSISKPNINSSDEGFQKL